MTFPPRKTHYIYICSRAADGWRAETVEAAEGYSRLEGNSACPNLHFGHLEFEYAVYLHSRCAWICVCRLQRRALRTMEGAPLKSAGSGSKHSASTGAPRAPSVQRLATGDG